MDTKKPCPTFDADGTRESSARFPSNSAQSDLQLTDWRPGRTPSTKRAEKRQDAFLQTQQENLLELRASLVASMNGIARETRLEKAESSAFSTHSGGAGSDAFDRDLVLSFLSQGTDSLLQIDEALARIEAASAIHCSLHTEASRLVK